MTIRRSFGCKKRGGGRGIGRLLGLSAFFCFSVARLSAAPGIDSKKSHTASGNASTLDELLDRSGKQSSRKGTREPAPVEFLKPSVEVSTKSASVKLTLSLLDAEIRSGEKLRYWLSVTNLGKVGIPRISPCVLAPTAVRHNGRMKKFIYFDIVDPEGIPVPWAFLGTETVFDDSDCEGIPAGVRPGETRSTLPWAYNPYDHGAAPKQPGPLPQGQFSELPDYDLSRPGNYKIRAVYDFVIMEEYNSTGKSQNELMQEGAIRIETPWIEFSILP